MKNLPIFNNAKLLELAFIHRSYLNETKEKIESNERLEFLGDSILSFIISEHLYNSYPNFDEGILTNIRSLVVNTKSLASLSRDIDLGAHLKLSRGEEDSKGRESESLLANSFEAFIGAMYLDQGIEQVKTYFLPFFTPKIEELVEKRSFKDPKSMLQELVQSQKKSSPSYKVLHEEGPSHAKQFTMGVYVQDELLGEGTGKSKQQAEEAAAKQALNHLQATDTTKNDSTKNK